jgi:abequosyltransferase
MTARTPLAPATVATRASADPAPVPAAARLSIAVPTYRRAYWLGRCLAEVLAQVAPLPPNTVEVLVSDNASPDETPAVLAGLKALHPALRVHRNPTNIGPEANFRLLRDLARGDYLWVLGDDDLLLPGAVARVLDLIGQGYDYMILDCMCFDEEMRVCRNKSLLRLPRDLPFTRADTILNAVHLGLGFISINVGRRELFGNVSEAEHRHFARWGMSFFLEASAAASRARTGIAVATPLLKARRADPAEYGVYNYFSVVLEGPHEACEILRERFGYRRRYLRRFKGAILRRLAWRRLAYERLTGELDVARARRTLRAHYGSYPLFWLTCAPLLYLPGVARAVRVAVWLRGGERARRLLAREGG